MALVPTFKTAAIERGLLRDGAPLDAAVAFALVRDMPYRHASSREPEATIAEWCGTCSGKHILPHRLFTELGVPATMILAPHEFSEANAPWLPPGLLDVVRQAPVVDVHNFLRVQIGPGDEWMTVDATWPLVARALGMPVNEALVPGRDMILAVDPIEVHHVPPDVEPTEMKSRILGEFAAGELERRETFLAALIEWLADSLPEPERA